MKAQPREFPSTSLHVADYRMTYRSAMYAQLVCPAGDRFKLDKCRIMKAF